MTYFSEFDLISERIDELPVSAQKSAFRAIVTLITMLHREHVISDSFGRARVSPLESLAMKAKQAKAAIQRFSSEKLDKELLDGLDVLVKLFHEIESEQRERLKSIQGRFVN